MRAIFLWVDENRHFYQTHFQARCEIRLELIHLMKPIQYCRFFSISPQNIIHYLLISFISVNYLKKLRDVRINSPFSNSTPQIAYNNRGIRLSIYDLGSLVMFYVTTCSALKEDFYTRHCKQRISFSCQLL